MSGVYIPGFSKPESVEKCKFYEAVPFRGPYCSIWNVCKGIEACPLVPVPVTNADRIRALSDEDLAELIWGAESAGRAYGPRGKKAWLDWLREDAE